MTKEIIINGVDVSKCIHIDNWKHCNCCNDLIKTIYPKASQCLIEEDLRCEIYPNCYYKQLKRQQYYFEKIRAYELNSLDVDWDEYEQHACDTEYSPIVDFVELALGEKEDE